MARGLSSGRRWSRLYETNPPQLEHFFLGESTGKQTSRPGCSPSAHFPGRISRAPLPPGAVALLFVLPVVPPAVLLAAPLAALAGPFHASQPPPTAGPGADPCTGPARRELSTAPARWLRAIDHRGNRPGRGPPARGQGWRGASDSTWAGPRRRPHAAWDRPIDDASPVWRYEPPHGACPQ